LLDKYLKIIAELEKDKGRSLTTEEIGRVVNQKMTLKLIFRSLQETLALARKKLEELQRLSRRDFLRQTLTV